MRFSFRFFHFSSFAAFILAADQSSAVDGARPQLLLPLWCECAFRGRSNDCCNCNYASASASAWQHCLWILWVFEQINNDYFMYLAGRLITGWGFYATPMIHDHNVAVFLHLLFTAFICNWVDEAMPHRFKSVSITCVLSHSPRSNAKDFPSNYSFSKLCFVPVLNQSKVDSHCQQQLNIRLVAAIWLFYLFSDWVWHNNSTTYGAKRNA